MFKRVVVIIVLPLVIWLVFGLTGWPFHLDVIFLLMPLFVSLLILWKFGKADIASCIGLLALKPVLNLLLSYIPRMFLVYEELNSIYPYNIVRAVLWAIPELLLTIIIIYTYRQLFRKERLLLIFLIGDLIRWVSVFISFWLPDPIPEPYFYWQLYLGVFFIFLFPFMYAIAGLTVVKRIYSQNDIY